MYHISIYYGNIFLFFGGGVGDCTVGTMASTGLDCSDRVSFHSFYTDSMHVEAANLLSEIIMVRDGLLSLPTWLSRDHIDDIISSVCV